MNRTTEPERQASGRCKEAFTMKKEKAIERAFDTCNLIGENVDILQVIYRYKALRELPDAEIDQIYDDIADRLGFHQR
jgi:hypothetical protein